jgi:hypothetical protein
MTTTWIRATYGVVLAIVLLLTVSTGVAMALPGPEPPQDPGITFRQLTAGDTEQSQNTLTAAVDRFYADAKDFRDDFVEYQRNTLLAGAGLAALLAVIGLVLPVAVNYLRFGLLLGAGLSLLWAAWVAWQPVPQPAPPASSILALVSAGEPQQLEFASRFLLFALSFVGLILLLFIGLWRLTEWPSATRRTTVTTTTQPVTAPVAAAPSAVAASPAPATAAAAWAPPPSAATPPVETTTPAATTLPAATESATVVSDSPRDEPPRSEPPRTEPPRSEPPDGEPRQAESTVPETVRWQRPSEGGEPARAPDTTT